MTGAHVAKLAERGRAPLNVEGLSVLVFPSARRTAGVLHRRPGRPCRPFRREQKVMEIDAIVVMI